SQSKSVDCVFVAESSESFRAADREQFYVSASRFKEGLTIYTDDKQQLLEAVAKSSARPSATDLVKNQFPENSESLSFEKRVAAEATEGDKVETQRQSGTPRREVIRFRRGHFLQARSGQSYSKARGV